MLGTWQVRLVKQFRGCWGGEAFESLAARAPGLPDLRFLWKQPGFPAQIWDKPLCAESQISAQRGRGLGSDTANGPLSKESTFLPFGYGLESQSTKQ